jgi:drug/metabolite transporter, DME family
VTSLGEEEHTAARHGIPLVASLMALSAGVVWSFGGVTTKKATHADAWQYLVWRSIGVIVVMEIISRRRRTGFLIKRAFFSGPRMILATVSLLLASVAYVFALKNTTAANAALLASITPLIAAVIARIFLKERLTVVTVTAIAVAFVGLLVMVRAPGSASNGSTLAGNLAAMLSSLGFASYGACVRSKAERDWSPVMPGYAAIAIVMCGAVALAEGRPFVPPAHDAALALVHGGAFIVIGTLLFNHASRSVPAVAMTIFAQTETVFVPIWVFAFIGERPRAQTIAGGAIILLAVVGKAVIDAVTRTPSTTAVPGPG